MATEAKNAIEMLKQDHRKVEELFKKFEKARDDSEKQQLVEQITLELETHMRLEEEIFYPTVRMQLEDDDLMDEAVEEHHAAKSVMDELKDMEPGDEHYDAKVIVLGEQITHHVKEEESDMFPKVKKLDLDLDELGEDMAEQKQLWMQDTGGSRGRVSSLASARPHR